MESAARVPAFFTQPDYLTQPVDQQIREGLSESDGTIRKPPTGSTADAYRVFCWRPRWKAAPLAGRAVGGTRAWAGENGDRHRL